jgi:hypothetical protein
MGIFDGVLGGQSGIAAQGLVGGGAFKQCSEEELLQQQYAMQAQINQMNLYNEAMKGQGVQATTRAKPFNPNEDAAYNIPLSQLITLWQANYGDQWVKRFDDDFWNSARARLHNNDKLEGVSGWYRIKEDA